jgi:chromosome segregation ATPase
LEAALIECQQKLNQSQGMLYETSQELECVSNELQQYQKESESLQIALQTEKALHEEVTVAANELQQQVHNLVFEFFSRSDRFSPATSN